MQRELKSFISRPRHPRGRDDPQAFLVSFCSTVQDCIPTTSDVGLRWISLESGQEKKNNNKNNPFVVHQCLLFLSAPLSNLGSRFFLRKALRSTAVAI